MLEYFPGVYWPNLLFSNAAASGAPIGDLDDACRKALNLMKAGTDVDSQEFIQACREGGLEVCEKLERLIAEDLSKNHAISASNKFFRQAAMLAFVELLMTDFYDPQKLVVFDRSRESLKNGIKYGGFPHNRSSFVTYPFEGQEIDALLTLPYNSNGPAPVVIHLNGTHSNIEWQYLIGIVDELAKRGIASLSMDHPGSGSARYYKGMKYRPDSESYVGAAIDFLENQKEIDSSRVGVCGSSFGGYFAPRATAFETRIKACAVWGATYTFPTVRYFPKGRPSNGGPVSDPKKEFKLSQWRWGFDAKDNIDLYDKTLEYTMKGVMDKIKVPLFIVHGKNDPQVSVDAAKRQLLEATNSPSADLLIIGPEIGGDMHCNVDNPDTAMSAISDWLADCFQV